MNINEFFGKYDDQFVEVGGSPNALNQCVDLANRYLIDVVDHEPILGTNADDFPSKCMDFCDWYPNTPSGEPEEGDVVIWDMGSYGHIAVYVNGNSRSFTSFDQNYPLNSPCHFQSHNYNGVVGWLRPRKEDMSLSKLDLVRNNIDWFYRTFLHVETEEELMSHVNNVLATFDQTTNGNSLRTELESMAKSDEFQGKWVLKADCKSDCSVQDQKIKDLEDAIILKTGQFESETMQIEKEHAEFEKTANEEMSKRNDLISACKTNLTIATDGLKKCQATQPPTIPVTMSFWQRLIIVFRNMKWR